MTWKLTCKKQAWKFLNERRIFEKVEMKILGYIKGEKQDIKRLKGNWEGFLRLRMGGVRVIFEIDVDNQIIRIVKAGFRGKIYK